MVPPKENAVGTAVILDCYSDFEMDSNEYEETIQFILVEKYPEAEATRQTKWNSIKKTPPPPPILL